MLRGMSKASENSKATESGTEPIRYLYHHQTPTVPSRAPQDRAAPVARARGAHKDSPVKRSLKFFFVVLAMLAAILLLAVFFLQKQWAIKIRRSRTARPAVETTFRPRAAIWVESVTRSPLPAGFTNRYRPADETLRAFERAMNVLPALDAPWTYAGRVWLANSNYFEARVAFERAGLEPTSPVVLRTLLGQVALEERRYDDAVRLLNASLLENPRQPDACRALAAAYFAQGQYRQAWDWIERRNALAEPDAATWKLRANLQTRAGQYEEALGSLEKALEVEPTWSALYLEAASVAAVLKRTDHAVRLLQDALPHTSLVLVFRVFQEPVFRDIRLSEEGRRFTARLAEEARRRMKP